MSLSPTSLGDEARLFLREEELDAALELFMLAEAALRASAEGALEGEPANMGRSHYRAAFLMKRRIGASRGGARRSALAAISPV